MATTNRWTGLARALALLAAMSALAVFFLVEQPRPAAAQSAPALMVCNGVNFTGTCEAFRSNTPDLRGTWLGNDTASSVHPLVAGTYSLYSNINYSGTCMTVTGDILSLIGTSIGNDTASSIKLGAGCSQQFLNDLKVIIGAGAVCPNGYVKINQDLNEFPSGTGNPGGNPVFTCVQFVVDRTGVITRLGVSTGNFCGTDDVDQAGQGGITWTTVAGNLNDGITSIPMTSSIDGKTYWIAVPAQYFCIARGTVSATEWGITSLWFRTFLTQASIQPTSPDMISQLAHQGCTTTNGWFLFTSLNPQLDARYTTEWIYPCISGAN